MLDPPPPQPYPWSKNKKTIGTPHCTPLLLDKSGVQGCIHGHAILMATKKSTWTDGRTADILAGQGNKGRNFIDRRTIGQTDRQTDRQILNC